MKYVEGEHVDRVVDALMPHLPNVSPYSAECVVEEMLGLSDPEVQTVMAQHLPTAVLSAELARRIHN